MMYAAQYCGIAHGIANLRYDQVVAPDGCALKKRAPKAKSIWRVHEKGVFRCKPSNDLALLLFP